MKIRAPSSTSMRCERCPNSLRHRVRSAGPRLWLSSTNCGNVVDRKHFLRRDGNELSGGGKGCNLGKMKVVGHGKTSAPVEAGSPGESIDDNYLLPVVQWLKVRVTDQAISQAISPTLRACGYFSTFAIEQ